MSDETKPQTGHGPARAVTVQADAAITPGVYSNLAMITHRKEEFVFDFLFVQPQGGNQGEPVAQLRSRVIASPGHTKRLLRALEENVRRYEAQFGPIEEAEPPPILQ
ncbi:MAG: DUF3467 domain-containing protein [Candidatus Binatia bacterium]|nr:DUF3467 domain-containing protein [Candidatus Binatia bacterium]